MTYKPVYSFAGVRVDPANKEIGPRFMAFRDETVIVPLPRLMSRDEAARYCAEHVMFEFAHFQEIIAREVTSYAQRIASKVKVPSGKKRGRPLKNPVLLVAPVEVAPVEVVEPVVEVIEVVEPVKVAAKAKKPSKGKAKAKKPSKVSSRLKAILEVAPVEVVVETPEAEVA